MTGNTDSAASFLDGKIAREGRLRWQSHLLLGFVSTAAGIGLVANVCGAKTAATAEGLAICAALGALVWRLRAATPGAAFTGFLLTACLYLRTVEQPNGGWFHTALLPGLALFILAFAATRFRYSQKEQVGLAESGRRASQVAANMGAAALAAVLPGSWLLILIGPQPVLPGRTYSEPLPFALPFVLPALAAALAEAAADTVSSEVGQAIGGSPRLITTLRRVPPGADGGITLAGTIAGCIAAAVVVLAAVPSLRFDSEKAGIAGIAAITGLFADSLLGATLERRGWLNNDAVNFLSTAIAALGAAYWSLHLRS